MIQSAVTARQRWSDRGGNDHSQVLAAVFTASDQLDAGFEVPDEVMNAANDRWRVPVPLLDIDEVNAFFQGEARSGRLELEAVGDAWVELLIELTGSGPFEVFAGMTAGGGVYNLIDGDELFAGPTPSIPSGAILTGADGSVLIDLEALRLALGIESARSASNYYACLNPLEGPNFANLADWLSYTGFEGADDVVSARYTNNYDLGFARDMHLREADDGSVYSYVVNHPSLEQLIKGVDEFATVAMEYSAAPTGDCGDGTFSADKKIVKFYAFVPDVTTGEMKLSLSMNFDGRGERFLPGVCTACHDGDIVKTAAFGAEDLADIAATNADLSASFMPWDIDSLLFADAENPSLIDPSLNPDEFSVAQLEAASLEGQQEAIRALNEGTLATYLGDINRYEEPLRLIHGWYGNETGLPAPYPDESESALEDALEGGDLTESDLTDLPAVDFDGSYVQLGWRGEETFYFDVYARYCRLCHTQQDELSKNFDNHDEFVNASGMPVGVFDRGIMPAARLTFDRFWVDFEGGADSGAELLRAHLNSIHEEDIDPIRIPGAPVAVVQASPIFVEGVGELPLTTINLDGTGSHFADAFFWSLTKDDLCPGPLPTILGETSPQASFVVESAPCEYVAKLEVESNLLASEATERVETIVIPIPVLTYSDVNSAAAECHGCHSTSRARLISSCLIDDNNLDIGDCSSSPDMQRDISADLQDLLKEWVANGAPE